MQWKQQRNNVHERKPVQPSNRILSSRHGKHTEKALLEDPLRLLTLPRCLTRVKLLLLLDHEVSPYHRRGVRRRECAQRRGSQTGGGRRRGPAGSCRSKRKQESIRRHRTTRRYRTA